MEDDDLDVEDVENEEQFWEEIEDISSTPCRTHDRIDDTLRTWIALITRYRKEYVHAEEHIIRCASTLLAGSLVSRHEDYVRRQLVYALLQEDDPTTLHLIISFLLLSGQTNDVCHHVLAEEGGFARLVDLTRHGVDDERGLHRRMLVLLYEMSRIQKIEWAQLTNVDDAFIVYLLDIIESLSGDVGDPWHGPVIRVLLVLNEQYMISTHGPGDEQATSTSNGAGQATTNRVVKTLSTHGSTYMTFGENIILLLNRESETSLQLLILKLFYLIFTTPTTYEYFYTNDLHVLVDILIRNLLDLPPDSLSTPTTTSLRHTYLRVLHPLLTHTQLSRPPHYKKNELRKLLLVLADVGHTHFECPDETTIRLVGRCLKVHWLQDSRLEVNVLAGDESPSSPSNSQTLSPLSRSQTLSPVEDGIKAGQAAVAKKLLGISLPEAQESALSVNEVAAMSARPGVVTESVRERNETGAQEERDILSPASEASENPFSG